MIILVCKLEFERRVFMRTQVEDDRIPVNRDVGVTIFHGSSQVNIERKKFQVIIFQSLQESCDMSKIGKNKGKYLNAFEWLLSNLYRTAGIQLYSDYDIRINILPEQVDFKKRCLFLTDAQIIDTKFNSKLYIDLCELIYGKVSKNVC